MEKTFSFLEGFGDAGQGDGFAGQVGDLPGSTTMTACMIARFGAYDLVNGVIPAATGMQIAGQVSGPAPTGWGFGAAFTGVGSFIDVAALAPLGHDFVNAGKAVAGHTIVMHVVADAADPAATGKEYINGTLFASANIAPVFPNVRPAIGIPSIPLAVIVPFGYTTSGVPGPHNGVAGMAYGEFAMTTEQVASHYRQIVEAEDMIQGFDAAGAPFGFTNLYSTRRGLAGLDNTVTVWPDEIGNVPFTREQIGGQAPSLQVRSRLANMY